MSNSKLQFPEFSTGNDTVNTAFRLAMHDISLSVVPREKGGLLNHDGHVLNAGAEYGLWVRDAAINTWNGVALFMPEVSRNSLLPLLEKKASGYFLKTPEQLWDAIIWVIGAWWQYVYTHDRPFLELAYAIGKDLIAYFEREWRDPQTGLFVGNGVTSDAISGYPDQYLAHINRLPTGEVDRDDWIAARENPKRIGLLSLSTNCVYVEVYRVLAEIEKVLDVTSTNSWANKADTLRAAVNRHFWDPSRRYYRGILNGTHDLDIQEGLGHSFALLFEIADKDQSDSVLREQYHTPHGIPFTWPIYPRFIEAEKQGVYGRTNGTVWPEICGFWATAAIKHRHFDLFESQILSIAKKAVRDGYFAEVFHPQTGEQYGGIQLYPRWPGYPPTFKEHFFPWLSKRHQVWCATAFFRMVTMGIVGMNFHRDRVAFTPYLPSWIQRASLKGLRYANMTVDIEIAGEGNTVESFRLNGKKADVCLPGNLEGHQKITIVVSREN